MKLGNLKRGDKFHFESTAGVVHNCIVNGVDQNGKIWASVGWGQGNAVYEPGEEVSAGLSQTGLPSPECFR